MTQTPWGDSGKLRERKLAPGNRASREEVARSQRERLFAAMVAAVAERGYEATTVADLLVLSGVSRAAFYEHLANKEGCFLATLEEIIQRTSEAVSVGYDGRGSALGVFIELIVGQPAASRVCFVEAFAAGPEAVAAMDQAVAGFERLVGRGYEERGKGAKMPAELVEAIVGGLRKVIYSRLRREQEGELGGLARQLGEWSLGYQPPPAPLRRRVKAPPKEEPERASSARERIIAAAGELFSKRGYPETSVRGIIAAAASSSETFYKHFKGKEDLFEACLDSGQARLGAAGREAYEREEHWPEAVRASLEAMVDFLAADPAFARLFLVAIMTGTTGALERRDQAIESLRAFLEPGYERSPKTPRIAAEAIGGAVYELAYRRVREGEAETLAQSAPQLTYLTLAPFLGAEEACAVANDG